MEIIIELPTKSYLRKYVEKSFPGDLKLTERSWLGVLVLNVLKRKTFKDPNYIFHGTTNNFDDSLLLKVDLDKSSRYGCILMQKQIVYINRCIDQIFKAEVIKMALINQYNYEIDRKTSIINVLDAYDITEEELNYQTIRKEFNRKHKQYRLNL